MVLQISVNDDKAELFLQLVQELKSSMVEKYHIIDSTSFDEKELLNRVDDIHNKRVKPLSRKEVFDGIC